MTTKMRQKSNTIRYSTIIIDLFKAIQGGETGVKESMGKLIFFFSAWALVARIAIAQPQEEIQKLFIKLLVAYHERDAMKAAALFVKNQPGREELVANLKQSLSNLDSYDYSDVQFGDWDIEEGAVTFLCSFRLVTVLQVPRVRSDFHMLIRVRSNREDGEWRLTAPMNQAPEQTLGDPINQAVSNFVLEVNAPNSDPSLLVNQAFARIPKFADVPIVERLNSSAMNAVQTNMLMNATSWNQAALAFAQAIGDNEDLGIGYGVKAQILLVSGRDSDAHDAVEEGLRRLGTTNARTDLAAMLDELGCRASIDLGQYEKALEYTDSALTRFNPIIQQIDDRLRYMALKSHILRFEHDPRAAITATELINSAKQQLSAVYEMTGQILLGEALADQGHPQEAEAAMRAGLNIPLPGVVGTELEYYRLPLIFLLIDTGQYDRAIVEIEKSRRAASLAKDSVLDELVSRTESNLLEYVGDYRSTDVLPFGPEPGRNGTLTMQFPEVATPFQRLMSRDLFHTVDEMTAENMLALSRRLWPKFSDLSTDPSKLAEGLNDLVVEHPIKADRDLLKDIISFLPYDEPRLTYFSGDDRLNKGSQWVRLLALSGRKSDALLVADQIVRRAEAYHSDRVLKQILLNIALALSVPECSSESERYLKREEALPSNVFTRLEGQMIQGRLFEIEGKHSAAAGVYRNSVEVIHAIQTAGGDPTLLMSVNDLAYEATYRLCRLLVEDHKNETAFQTLEALKGRTLVQQLQSPIVFNEHTLTADQLDHLHALDTQIQAAMSEDPSQGFGIGTRVMALRLRRDLYLQGVSNKGKAHVDSSALQFQKLRPVLFEGKIRRLLLSYITGDDGIILFAVRIDANSAVTIDSKYVPASDEELREHILDFTNACSAPEGISSPSEGNEARQETDFKSSSIWLYKKLIEPFDELVKTVDEVIISPDGQLSHLPFAALQNENHEYFIQRVAVSYIPSATVLLLLRGEASGSSGRLDLRSRPLIVGNPAIANTVLQKLSLGDIGPTGLQAKRLALTLKALPLMGTSATKSEVVRRLGNAGLIYFATHAIVIMPADYSTLFLAPTEDDEGFLTARDIRGLKLRARLVVLAACRTSQGDLRRSEGYSGGLAWSFLSAGCPTAIVTQWDAQGPESTLIMDDFYNRLFKLGNTATTAQCLAVAMRRILLDPDKHPYYWALYSLVGDSR